MNRKIKWLTVFVSVISIGISLFSFSFVEAKTDTVISNSNIKSISLDISNLTLELEQNHNLTVVFNPKSSMYGKEVKWTSSDTDVVTVTNGNVYAKGIGTAYVYADYDTCITFCKITVLRHNPVNAVKNKNFTGYTGTDLDVVTKAADIIEKYITSDMTDEQKAKAIYDYLLANCKYDYRTKESVPKSSYGIIGPLVKNTAVDEGYSYTFKYFMDILGIGCRMTLFRDYQGNQVYLKERWHPVGVSWDNPIYGFGTDQYKLDSIVTPTDAKNTRITTWDEVDFESILFQYREDTYSGNATADTAFFTEGNAKEQEFVLTLDANFPYSKQYKLNGEAIRTETIKENQKCVPAVLPSTGRATGIYVSSFNTKADGTGISYPAKSINGIRENLYLYCIWSVAVKQPKVTPAGGNDSFTLKWSKVASCNEYQLRYSVNSSMKNAVTKTITGQEAKITGLNDKAIYYVQVRGYVKDDNGNITYGKWSIKKPVKTH